MHRAAVVVRGGDGAIRSACVSFDAPSIGGLALLERSGLDVNVQVSGGGAAVCSIAGQGCHFPSEACFCQCQGGGPCRYWTYWHLNGGTWQYAAIGAAGYQVPPGGVDGWAWGDSGGDESGPPPTSFEKICRLPKPVPLLPTAARPYATPTIPRVPASPVATRTEPATAATTPAALSSRPNAGRYIFFAGALAALVAAIGLVMRRRR